jgi:Type II secretion system (T2SS), protein E, N-terminal domain
MEPKKSGKIGEILVEDGLLSKAQLEEALALQREKGGLLGQILIEKKFIDEESLIGTFGKQFKLPYIPLKNYAINPDMGGMLAADFCHKNTLVAFDCDSKRVYVAMADPMNAAALDEIRKVTGRIPQVFLARISEVLNAVFFIYHEGETDRPS